MKTNLKGNSGFDLIRDGKYVIKSGTGRAKERLERQAQKQCAFEKFVTDKSIISAVPVISANSTDTLYAFEMQYVPGPTLAEYIRDNGSESYAPFYMSAIGRFVRECKTQNSDETIVFEDKIQSLKKQGVDTIDFIHRYEGLIHNFPIGYCHGDLTLENIIVADENNLKLIDFLDSFVSSPLCDAATVMQDTLLHWSYRYEELNTKQLDNIMNAHEVFVKSIGPMYEQALPMLLMKVYRIAPYIKDETTAKWYEKNLKYLLSFL